MTRAAVQTKRVLIFATNYFPNVGGAEVAVKEITDRIASRYLTFVLITPRLSRKVPPIEKIGAVDVYRVGFGSRIDKWILPVTAFLKAERLHRKEPFTMTWSLMASQASIAAAFFKKRHRNIKLILTLQEGDEESHLMRYVFGMQLLYRVLIRPFHLMVFKQADLVTAISSYLKERALQNGVTAPVIVVPNAANVELFNQEFPQDELAALKHKLGKKEQEYFIVTTSRLVKKNAISDIIQSLVYLPINIKFLIIGEGEEYNSLRSLAEVYGVSTRVKFLGFVPNQELPKYLKISEVFVRPSLSEGFGVSFVEAMAAKIPVIATPVGGIVDFLKDNETGLFCNVRHPRSIAEKILLLKDNPTLRDRIIKNAHELVLQEYTWNAVAKSMREKAFNAVLAQS